MQAGDDIPEQSIKRDGSIVFATYSCPSDPERQMHIRSDDTTGGAEKREVA